MGILPHASQEESMNRFLVSVLDVLLEAKAFSPHLQISFQTHNCKRVLFPSKFTAVVLTWKAAENIVGKMGSRQGATDLISAPGRQRSV